MSKASRAAKVSEFKAKLSAMGFASYAEYLKSPHWADVRRRYWASKLPKLCHGCGAHGVPLDLHHRTYKRIGAEYLMDLVLVCRDCHQEVHRYEKKTSVHMWRSTNRVLRRKRKEVRAQG